MSCDPRTFCQFCDTDYEPGDVIVVSSLHDRTVHLECDGHRVKLNPAHHTVVTFR